MKPSRQPARQIAAPVAFAALVGLATGFALSRAAKGEARSKGDRRDGAVADGSRQGATADAPSEIPASGWMAVLRRTYGEIGRDRVPAVAAGVTFYGILALVPAIAAFVSLYGLVADRATVIDHLALLEGVLPAGAFDLVREQVERLVTGDETKLGFAFALGLGLSIWSANAGVKAIFDALNVAYGEEEKRGFVRLNAVSLTFTTAILVFVLMAIGSVAVIPVMLDVFSLGSTSEWILWLGRWPLMVVLLALGLSALYRFGPSRDDAQWSWVSAGALFASIAWLVASVLFSWYVANFEDYNKTYGALGAVIGLLMWMWISTTIVLVGAELNSEAERQTLRDTTTGAPKPVGLRGADAADRKG